VKVHDGVITTTGLIHYLVIVDTHDDVSPTHLIERKKGGERGRRREDMVVLVVGGRGGG